jgi:hypothetical protein
VGRGFTSGGAIDGGGAGGGSVSGRGGEEVVAPVHCALMRSSVEGGEAAREAGEAAARSAGGEQAAAAGGRRRPAGGTRPSESMRGRGRRAG